MKHHRRNRDFWERWSEVRGEEDENDPRQAWREHLRNHFGVAPEKHWLLRGRRFRPWIHGRRGGPMRFNPFLAGVLSQGGGLLALYVLHLIAGAPRYGNEVMRELETRTKGGWLANPGAIYPLLEVMESRRLIEGEWEEPEKRTRRIYRITPAGEEELERLTSIMRPKLEEAIRILQTMNADLKRGTEEA